ncbi:MalY/PatB family protein [Amaricoccus tamworthensis]|uniref:MalY/PatB family protein n=1 Tax=Amaricoccus tamworthensis TaxID=57002 RepID=UPI003C7DBD64
MYDFDEEIDRYNTHSQKWDGMEDAYGVSPEDGLAMWVAEMDFRPPQQVNDVVMEAARHGIHGYFAKPEEYLASITGWMERRHGWTVQPREIASVHGIVAGVGKALRAYSERGDGIILFTPVYHAFARVIKANKREVVESPLELRDGRFEMNLERLEASLTGREKMVIFCSPHNPGGRIWSRDELRAVAAFCEKHDLVLVSDEIHHDLVFPGETHIPMVLAAPEQIDRTVMMSATTKAFNIAGALTGNVIIQDDSLRRKFDADHSATGKSMNRIGALMATAAYQHGDEWLDALCPYLARNAEVFREGVESIPGAKVHPMQGTYLAWADFSGTGMENAEIVRRFQEDAKIAASHGPDFGTGGAQCMRVNIGTTRARVEEAVSRLQRAFGDLQ